MSALANRISIDRQVLVQNGVLWAVIADGAEDSGRLDRRRRVKRQWNSRVKACKNRVFWKSRGAGTIRPLLVMLLPNLISVALGEAQEPVMFFSIPLPPSSSLSLSFTLVHARMHVTGAPTQ